MDNWNVEIEPMPTNGIKVPSVVMIDTKDERSKDTKYL